MQYIQDHPSRRGRIRQFLISRPKLEGNNRVHAYGETHGDRIYQILRRKYQRQCRHGILTDFCHIKAVYYVVQ